MVSLCPSEKVDSWRAHRWEVIEPESKPTQVDSKAHALNNLPASPSEQGTSRGQGTRLGL